jgi:environmental stress-induced protein Ves
VKILRKQDLIDVPWKNGAGITRHIAQASHGAQEAWRISRADVKTDGAFSDFSGLIRILTVVSDTGMSLKLPHTILKADPWVPVKFNGSDQVYSELHEGPLTDLNLMFDPTLCDGSATCLRGPFAQDLPVPSFGVTVLHVLAGQPQLGSTVLGVADTAVLDASSPLLLRGDDAVLAIEIRYPDQSKDITWRMAER